jgi:hypothetical protein
MVAGGGGRSGNVLVGNGKCSFLLDVVRGGVIGSSVVGCLISRLIQRDLGIAELFLMS